MNGSLLEELSSSNLDLSMVVAGKQFTPARVVLRLRERLGDLLERGAALGAVLTIPLETGATCLASGATVFITREVYERLSEIPLDTFDEWLVEDLLADRRNVLAREEIARANASGGLHLFALYWIGDDLHLNPSNRPKVVSEMMQSFFTIYAGYNLRALVARLRHPAQVPSALRAGLHLMSPVPLPPTCDDALLPHPVLVGAERETVDYASWLARLFVWSRPKFGFSDSEQRTLSLSLRGVADKEIAALCCVSPSTIKKRWDSIIARVSRADPDFFPAADSEASPEGRRGVQKRSHILRYVAGHPEELRPYQN